VNPRLPKDKDPKNYPGTGMCDRGYMKGKAACKVKAENVLAPSAAQSPLFKALCAADKSGQCTFATEVVLPASLTCHGHECDVETTGFIKITSGKEVGFYEYVPAPCVDLTFFNDGQMLRTARHAGMYAPTASGAGIIIANAYPTRRQTVSITECWAALSTSQVRGSEAGCGRLAVLHGRRISDQPAKSGERWWHMHIPARKGDIQHGTSQLRQEEEALTVSPLVRTSNQCNLTLTGHSSSQFLIPTGQAIQERQVRLWPLVGMAEHGLYLPGSGRRWWQGTLRFFRVTLG
jgi:hypothetical protein